MKDAACFGYHARDRVSAAHPRRYLCLVKGDWDRGVAMLALGSDEPLKTVAVMELQGAETAEDQAAIGDAWWDAAESREGQEGDLLRLRAGSWYRRAAPQLVSGQS